MTIGPAPDVPCEDSPLSLDALRRMLRYQPGLISRMEDLLDVVAAHLPRVIARRVVEAPLTGPLALPIEGTVVFADIDGFTPLSERFAQAASEEGTEELTDLVNRFLEILITTTIPYGGDIQKFGGDAGMLLFTGEQHALRAIKASLEVQEMMETHMGEVDTSVGRFPLRISIGMGSGHMVGMGLGNQEGREWLLTGNPLKTMGHAQSMAPPGAVVVESATADRCDKLLDCECIDNKLYLVKGIREQPAPHPLAPLPLPPQVEEAEHLNWLLSRLDALTPYLAPGLLERLTTAADPKQVQQWSEHRQVTILMISLTGFPDLSVHWNNPEALQRTVHEPNDVFIRARDIVHQYDGIVNKIGASPQGAYLMVLFGAPQAHEDDPLRAVLAALELQERAELPLRIGINSGFVFAGNVGTVERREYTVMGDEVNLAYRLMAASEPGKIWLGPNTARHPIIQRRVGGEPGTPQKFKGKSGLITPFIARSVRRIFTGAETEAIPLIGRDEELQQLTSALEQLQTGTPQVVTLHGPAGIGKSRLAHEVAALAGEVGVNVYQGTAPSYGAHLPYAAWERPLLDLLDLQNVPQEERERAFEQALTRYDLGHWGALLAPLIGLDIPPTPEIAALSPEQREEQRQNTLCALWAQAAQQTPALLIMENAHWMPPSSMTLLNAIVQAEADAPLMLLITYRDDQAFARAWQDQAEESDRQTWRAMEWRTIPLNPLPRRAIVQLARHIAGASRLPPEVERWIARRGSGIPLFTIEAVRTLLTSGVLVRENGDWRLTQPLEEAPLPETAYGMIQSRIDQLEPPSRHLLRAATVVGEQMTVPMLVAGYGEEPRPTVQRRLARLTPLGLTPGDSRGETLVFRQPLIREVAYRGLPFRIRRLIHQRLGAYLNQYQEQATSNWLTLLAYHAFEGQDWEVAVRANLDLGKRAQRNYLMEQAVEALKRVSAAADAGGLAVPEVRLEAEHLLGQTLTVLGQYPEALQHLQQARQQLPTLPTTRQDIEQVGRLEYDIADAFIRQGHYQAALDGIERGLQLPDITHTIVGAQLQMEKAGLLHRQGNYDEEERWVRRSAEVVETLTGEEAMKIQARALYLLAYLASVRGNPAQALELGNRSLQIYEELQDLLGEMDARNNLLLINLALGRWDEAAAHGERAFSLAQRIHHSQGIARVSSNLGEIYRYQGRLSEAKLAYNTALQIVRESGMTYGEAVMENNLAAVALRAGNLSEAATRLDHAEQLLAEIGTTSILAELYRHRAELHLTRQALDEALEWASQSQQLAQDQGAQQELAQTLRVIADIYIAQGHPQEARQALKTMFATLEETGDRYGQARALLTEARLHLHLHEDARAQQDLDTAITMFEQLGASWDLAQAQVLIENK